MKSTRLATLCAALGLASILNFSAQAQITTFNDATNDIASGIATAGGTLDIVKMEVVDTETDVQFTMTVNGNFTAPNSDWGNFMVGIANQKTPGSTTGNGWNRPINLNAGGGNGMTHWIGSWNGGSQLWTYQVGGGSGTGSNWSGPAALVNYSRSAGAQSTVTFTVSKASLGVTNGDTIIFDAYSSGGGGGDSAIDALSNPTNSVADWGQAYTSSATNTTPVVGTGQTRSYTLANTALNTTQPITFQVDMRAQIGAGLFDPATAGIDVEWGAGFLGFAALADGDNDGIYTGSPSVSAPANTQVSYRFVISPNDLALPLQTETVARTFTMPSAPTTIAVAFFNNIAGYRDVTFSVDTAAAQTAGAFNPDTQTVQVRGPFNNWAGNTLTNTSGSVYGGTMRISSTADNQVVTYKYYVAATPQSQAIGFEGGADRSFNLAFNGNLNPQPAQALAQDNFVTPEFRPVTFEVDMTVLEAAGGFTPGVDSLKVTGSFNDWGTDGTDYQLTDEAPTNGVYTGTFIISGTNGGSISYKFFNTRTGAPNSGYESGSDRTATLSASGATPQVLPLVFWSNDSGQTRNVTFRVDMGVQQALGLFDPATGTVQLRSGSFGEGDARALTRQGTTAVFSGTFSIPGEAGTTFQYKLWSPGINFYNVPSNTGFEQIDLSNPFVNRTLTLGTSGVAMNPDVVYFSNQLFYVPGTPLSAFSTTQGTASTAQSITVSGQGLTGNIVATAPTGFEVSADGVSFAGTATLVPTAGVLNAASLSIRIASTAGAGAVTGNVSLASTGSQSATVAVSGTVTASGSTFAGWSSNAPVTSELVGKYGIGGATNSLAASEKPVSAVDSNTLSLSAIVRTNDNKLTVVGEAGGSLTNWSTNGVSNSVAGSQADVPEGHQRRVFSVDRTNSPTRQFLRLKATLQP